MGYFEGLASGSLKKDKEGRTVFYPMGILGKGRILPDEATESSVRAFLVRYYQVTLPVVIVLGMFAHWALVMAAAIALMVWFHMGTKALIKNCPISHDKLTLKEGYTNSAASHNSTTLWILTVCSALFVFGGLFMLLSAPATGLKMMGLASVVFFGATTAALVYMIRAKRT